MAKKKGVGDSGNKERPTEEEQNEAIKFLEQEGLKMNRELIQKLRQEKEAEKKGGESKG